jgi:hypothetical protein
MSALDPATISALSALSGSAIGALASVATTWFTQHRQEHTQRHNQEASRRERLFGEFIDQASQTFLDAIVQDGLDTPAKLIPMYATLSKLRLFATSSTIRAAEGVLERIIKTYQSPPISLDAKSSEGMATRDIVRAFAEACRTELKDLR